MEILFENSDAIIVNKPAQWLAVPGRDPKDTRPVLGRELEKELKTQIFPIHRLDAEVSGLIVYGKTAAFHRAANVLFENKTVTKTYQAFTPPGAFSAREPQKWESKILRGKKRTYGAPYGKDAVTWATLVRETPEVWEWRLNPVTGRSHQLRFELSKRGCPIWGDSLYGSLHKWTDGIALRAISLEFPVDFSEKWKVPERLEAPLLELP
jgi:tRNA pseudouridine32 synthase / 23S rRNA pseudouridine746 synthase